MFLQRIALRNLHSVPPNTVFEMRSLVVQAKELLEEAGFAKDGKAVVLGGSIIAGFCAAACSLPFDFVKTRIQKMEKQADGSYPYKSPVDCALKTFREEGFLKFYTGFPTYCLRCVSSAPCCQLCLCIMCIMHFRAGCIMLSVASQQLAVLLMVKAR